MSRASTAGKKADLITSLTSGASRHLFAGSGTAIIAAEEMERRCFSMEFDPQYAEVIIQRWEDKTSQIATKIEEVQHGKR